MASTAPPEYSRIFSTFTRNSANTFGGGISNHGNLTVTNSIFYRNGTNELDGGGIFNAADATVSISKSTFTQNSAIHGGGFSNTGGGTAIVSNSTFSGNTALSLGGGIHNGSGTLTLNNSTIYGNSSRGSEGGGISSSDLSVLDMANNIVAGNVGVDCLKFGPPVNATGPNLVQDGSCSAALSGDPMLAPLADNGGPTMTHALCTGPGEPDAACTGRSPAIDAVNNTACPDVDQRGEPRPVDGDGDGNAVCDIGAYELQVAFFAFEGFFPPVDNPSTVNAAKAGQGIPVKFGLGGDRGLDIFQMGYPKAVQIGCTDGMPTDLVEETVAAGGSGLQYDPATDTYTYVWKTDKQWAGQCRRLSVKLTDGSEHTALFQFK